jgi:hypothetical protein
MWEPEPCVWMVLVVKRARPSKRDSDSYGDDDLRCKKFEIVGFFSLYIPISTRK